MPQQIINKEDVSYNQRLSKSAFVQDIISSKQPFFIRQGITIFLIILLCIVGLCYFIKFPDVVRVSANFTSINAPKPVVSITGGKLTKLLVKENEQVKTNTAIGYLESNADPVAVQELDAYLLHIKFLLDSNQTEQLQGKNAFYLAGGSLGELQPAYQTFSQAFLNFKSYLANGFYRHKKNMMLADKQYLHKLLINLEQQRTLQIEDMQLSEKTFAANEKLKADKVISDFDYRNERSKLISKQLSLPQINSAIINNQSQQHDKLKEIMELENQISQQKSIFLQVVNTLVSQIEEWSRKYVLKAPIDGKVSFVSFLQENQQVTNNQIICYINPGNSSYFAEITIPQTNFGKVFTGQKVLLKLPSYPFQEFGAVHGSIEFINRIPTDSGYIAKVSLPHGLITNTKKAIQYHEGLKAQGEIITQDVRLLERFYYSIVGGIKN